MKKLLAIFCFFLSFHSAFALLSWTADSTRLILSTGQTVRLQNGQYDLALRSSGECALYKLGVKPLFSFSAAGSAARFLYLQTDGNLVLYNSTLSVALWSSGTAGFPGAKLTFNDSGNLVITSAAGLRLWGANTAAKADVAVLTYADFTRDSALSPTKIINPVYKTDDIVIADYNILDYGADSTGVTDVSTILQNTINLCYNIGGGVVWLPKGRYRIRKTITIPSGVTVRGDWNDPDSSASFSSVRDYGTTFLVDFKDSSSGAVFNLPGQSCGLYGLTFYYPHQNAYRPIQYDYTIKCSGYSAVTLKNMTLINAYRGIRSISTHQSYLYKNIRATCLKQGIYDGDAADVSVYQDININTLYWANSTPDLIPPPLDTLNFWTRNNGVGVTLAGLDWQQVERLKISNYKIGLITDTLYRYTSDTTGYTIGFSGSFVQLNIDSCKTGVLFNQYDSRFPPIFTNCIIKAFDSAVINRLLYPVTAPSWTSSQLVIFNYCDIVGAVGGSYLSFISSPSPKPPLSLPLSFKAVPRTTRPILYNVGLSPYRASRVLGNASGSLPTVDVTDKIQAALNQAGIDGGGVVYLPAGWYRLDGTLNVPANVVLMGANPLMIDDHVDAYLPRGTSLFTFNGHNTFNPDTATAFISLTGKNAGVSGLRIFQPARDFSDSIDYKYPYVIGSKSDSNYVTNCAIQDVYNGIDFAKDSCKNYYISNIKGAYTNNYIKVSGIGNGDILNVVANPVRINTVGHLNMVHNFNWDNFSLILNTFTSPKAVLIKVDSSASTYETTTISNVFQYGGYINVLNANPNTILYNTGLDNIGPGGYVIKSYSDMKVVNVLSYNPLTLTTPGYPVIFNVPPSGNIKLWSWSDIY